MIEILYIVPNLKRCGPTSQLYNLIKYLDRYAFRPKLITLSPEPADSRWQDFEKLGVELYTLGLSRIRTRLCMILPPATRVGFFLAISKLKRIIAKLDVHIIHTLGIRADAIAAMYLDGYRTVATLRSFPDRDYSNTYGKIAGHLLALRHLKILSRIESLVTVSNSLSTMLLARNNFATDVIQNGVDTDIFYPAVNDKCKYELRGKLGIPLTKKVFISTGHLTLLKDPLTIIKAFQDKHLSKACYIIFLGDGPLMDLCKKYGENGDMIFFGSLPNVAEYLQACDFFISSSQTEGLPNATMEAMACGLPCVLTDIKAHREIVEYNPRSAKLFGTKNVSMAVSKINEILKDDYSEMSKAAISIIRDNLNAKTMSEKYQRLYLKICAH
jgi:glycosyltransferase involved in cell wall biosynthesis